MNMQRDGMNMQARPRRKVQKREPRREKLRLTFHERKKIKLSLKIEASKAGQIGLFWI